jgi:hypothetical protein
VQEESIEGREEAVPGHVRVSTVDNFQGEEARVVIVSLVRSNPESRIGFLRSKQRVNVLLSRAREGLVLIGNAECLCQGSRLPEGLGTWDIVLKHMRMFKGFPAQCRHGNKVLLKSVEDFDKYAPNGGCQEPCNALLVCGHQCQGECHAMHIAHQRCSVLVPARCASDVALSHMHLSCSL